MSEAERSEKAEIGRASTIMAIFTLLSRLLGLVRNQILSHFFGAGFVADAFIAAFTIPNALRRLFGEGALTPSIVTLLTRALREPSNPNSPKPWQSFITSAFVWLSLFLIVLSLGIFVFAPWLVRLYVSDFSSTPGKLELTIQLTRFLSPFLIFIGWSAFFMGVLNTFRSFAVSAFVPAMLSISVALVVPVSLVYLFPHTEHGIYFYAGAILVGAFFQALLQIPSLKRKEALPLSAFSWADPRVLDLGKLMVPSFFSLAVYQLNIIINRNFASHIDGAVSHLFYADLLLELPVSLIATSLGTAVIPSFSRLVADQKRKELSETFLFSMEAVWSLALPCTFALIVLAEPMISTLYFSGKFSLSDAQTTARVLIFYACGLPFFATLRILLGLFFAEKNTKIPMYAGWFSLGVNFIAAWQLSSLMQASGIALATSISSMANIAFLLVFMKKDFPEIHWRKSLPSLIKILGACVAMSLILALGKALIPSDVWEHRGIGPTKILFMGSLVGLGTLTYFMAAIYLRVPHTAEFVQKWIQKLLGRF